MLRFLFRPRWLVLLAITVTVSVTCLRLGIWQMHRLQERRAYNAAVSEASSKPPIPLSRLAPPGGSTDVRSLSYRRVTVIGTYDVALEVVLYGRAQTGEPGNHVLTPLIMPDGRAVIVDRGWVPFSTSSPPVVGATPPGGSIVVTGVLEPSDPPGQVGPRPDHITTTTTVDVATLSAEIPHPTLPVYLWLQSQLPDQPGGSPAPAPLPPLSQGPYEGYMLQWFAFSLIFAGGYVLLVWREVLQQRRAGASVPPRTLVA